MGRSPRLDFSGAVHHVYTRGNARNNIFHNHDDRARFYDILREVKAERPFKLYADCLMSNHLHLLIEPLEASLSVVMQFVLNRYAKYINARLGRVGHVFQDRFRERLCLDDTHVVNAIRYIHRNPVAAEMVADPADWPYSGHREYLGLDPRGLLDQEKLLPAFGSGEAARAAYKAFAAMNVPEAYPDFPPTRRARRGELILLAPRTLGASLKGTPALETMAKKTAATFGITSRHLMTSTRVSTILEARQALIDNAFRSGYSISEIADHLGQLPSSVSRSLRRRRKMR
ncbi:MAG: transposase [Proteobacteria bacterium]|nr:transposase [Pseudomonadota bacterium]